jgi:hypothetical protein
LSGKLSPSAKTDLASHVFGIENHKYFQLAIIMVGKQAVNAALEMSSPLFRHLWKRYVSLGENKSAAERAALLTSQWAKDFTLIEWDSRTLFSEYLEMVSHIGLLLLPLSILDF